MDGYKLGLGGKKLKKKKDKEISRKKGIEGKKEKKESKIRIMRNYLSE